MENKGNNHEATKNKRQAYGRSAQQWREMRGISQEAMARALGLRDAKAVSRPLLPRVFDSWPASSIPDGSGLRLLGTFGAHELR